MYNFLTLLSLFLTTSCMSDELLYLASGGVIEVKKIDRKTGKLTDFQEVKMLGLSKFTFSRNKKFLYAQATINGDRKKISVATYKIADNGKLTLVYNASISGVTTELKTDRSDNFLAAANYRAGTVTVWKLEDGIYKGTVVKELAIEKKVHAVRFSPDNKFLLTPATGPNRVYELAFDQKSGMISRKTEALGPSAGASQPRHLVFHPNLNVAYTSLERNKPGVASWSWAPIKGQLKLMQNLSNSEDTTGRISNADLHISPDNKFLYVSCRDKKKERDHIALYKINANDGELTFVQKFACESVPRSFGFNKSGDFLYVCGQAVAKLGVYSVDKTTGFLLKVTEYDTGKGPIWVETLMK